MNITIATVRNEIATNIKFELDNNSRGYVWKNFVHVVVRILEHLPSPFSLSLLFRKELEKFIGETVTG